MEQRLCSLGLVESLLDDRRRIDPLTLFIPDLKGAVDSGVDEGAADGVPRLRGEPARQSSW